MKERIGKYKLIDRKDDLQVHYIYGISDLISVLFYLLRLALGGMFLYISIIRFDADSISDYDFWLLAVVGMGLVLFFLYLLVAGLYKPHSGVFQVDKKKKYVVVRDLFKSEIISFNEIRSLFCEIIFTKKPNQKYGMMYIGTSSGEKKECFIIRSSIPIDLGRKVDKDILSTANSVKNRIYKAMKS
jgi:hypothetical protein